MFRRSAFYRRIRLFSYVTLALLSIAAIVIIIRTDSGDDASRRLVAFGKGDSLPQQQLIGDDEKVQITIHDDRASNDSEQVCRIPQLQIDSPEVSKFFHDPKPLDCEKKAEKNWAYQLNNRFYITDEAVKSHGEINCKLVQFTRRTDHIVNSVIVDPIANGSKIENCDFFRAECRAADDSVWRNLFMTITPNNATIERLRSIKKSADWSGLNVYIIGFDSLSRLTFQRKMRESFKYLTEQLDAVFLEGYNIVGDGTPQAFIPILTSKTEVELPLTRKRYAKANYVDDVYPFIWKNFSENGYATLYGEDSAAVGTFTYRLKGFRRQPTDHYLRTFFQQSEKELKNLFCIGSEPQHVVWFRYAKELFDRYPSDIPKFSLLHHSQLSHDDHNLVQVADIDFRTHLQAMNESGHLDNTLLIVMADHGHRFADMRATHQGQLEERLPLFAVVLPKQFRDGKGRLAFENLRNNAKRLSTPFDVYSTLVDILHWPSNKDLTTISDSDKHRSLSLWRPIPTSRTCTAAGIEPHWCTCLQWESLVDQPEQLQLAYKLTLAVVQTINNETESERALCARLELDTMLNAVRMVPNRDLLRYRDAKDKDGFVPDLAGNTPITFVFYQLRLRTRPGAALYESTVRYDLTTERIDVDLHAISHVNKFGDTPHCVIDRNYFIATYCVCYDRMNATDDKQR